jgi:transposase
VPRKRNNSVILTAEDRGTLEGLIARGHTPARHLTHARILLKADEGSDAPGQTWPDTRISDALQISRSTVSRVRTRFVEEGLEAALVNRRPKNTKAKKLDGSQEAHLIALACSEPPKGKKRWSVRLLAERFVRLECTEESISRELVRRTLKECHKDLAQGAVVYSALR